MLSETQKSWEFPGSLEYRIGLKTMKMPETKECLGGRGGEEEITVNVKSTKRH